MFQLRKDRTIINYIVLENIYIFAGNENNLFSLVLVILLQDYARNSNNFQGVAQTPSKWFSALAQLRTGTFEHEMTLHCQKLNKLLKYINHKFWVLLKERFVLFASPAFKDSSDY